MKEIMKKDNRALGPNGARELTEEQTEHIAGGIITMTFVCTPPSPTNPKGENDHEGCLI